MSRLPPIPHILAGVVGLALLALIGYSLFGRDGEPAGPDPETITAIQAEARREGELQAKEELETKEEDELLKAEARKDRSAQGRRVANDPEAKAALKELRELEASATPATEGAHEAVEAISHECGEWASRRDNQAIEEAVAYLIREGRSRPGLEITELILEAASEVKGGFCRAGIDFKRSGRLLAVSGQLLEQMRPHNRFLDE